MTLIEWKDQYSLGNQALDHEHKTLINLINQVHTQILDGSPDVAGERILSGLGEISSSVAAHFALEERAMVASSYANLVEHKADHEKLLDEISDIMEAVESGFFEDFGERLSLTLQDWFSIHFQTFDREYHTQIHRDN
jgi:hemerythrin